MRESGSTAHLLAQLHHHKVDAQPLDGGVQRDRRGEGHQVAQPVGGALSLQRGVGEDTGSEAPPPVHLCWGGAGAPRSGTTLPHPSLEAPLTGSSP